MNINVGILGDPSFAANFGKKGTGAELKAGMVLAIEPMVAVGSGDIVHRPDDSYATADSSLSAHFEVTVAIVKDGMEVLTPCLKKLSPGETKVDTF